MRTTSYSFREMTIEQLPELLELQATAARESVHPDGYVALAEDEFRYILEGQGCLLGCFHGEELIAFHSIWYPGEHPDNLGIDLNFASENLHRVAHLEAACVHPSHRGQRLQTRMTEQLMQRLRAQSNIRYVLETVSPRNVASLISTFRAGLVLVGYKMKYGGKPRFLFQTDLHSESASDAAIDRSPTQVEITNIEAEPMHRLRLNDSMADYQKLFQQGWVGFACERIDDQHWILFQKRSACTAFG